MTIDTMVTEDDSRVTEVVMEVVTNSLRIEDIRVRATGVCAGAIRLWTILDRSA